MPMAYSTTATWPGPMTDMSILTRYIFQDHPEKKEQIWKLMLRNPDFRTLCTDYGKCVEAREFWGQSQDPNAKAKAEEYRYLCKVLEKECLQVLEGNVERPDKIT